MQSSFGIVDHDYAIFTRRFEDGVDDLTFRDLAALASTLTDFYNGNGVLSPLFPRASNVQVVRLLPRLNGITQESVDRIFITVRFLAEIRM